MSALNKFFARNSTNGELASSVLQSAREGNLCLKVPSNPEAPNGIIKDQDRYYLQKDWVYETHIVENVNRLRKIAPTLDERFLHDIDNDNLLSLEQKKVAKQLNENAFSILCGGPGTGKTHTAARFAKHFGAGKIILSAPTGLAALHLQSKIGLYCEAMTLHRLLRLKPGETNLFSKKRIDADLVIVDEASMMDVTLFAHLIGAIGDHTRLILMGDPNQLPPIDVGSVFADLAELYGIYLQKCMRTEDPLLQQTALAILSGDEEQFFTSVTWREKIEIDYIYEWIHPIISPHKKEPPIAKVACLNALRQGPLGLDALNRQILEKMGQRCPDGWWWTVPIMVNTNLPAMNLFNGTTGFLIGQKNKRINLLTGTAIFPEIGELKQIPPYDLAFVMSIHKSQGSEYDQVLALFPEGAETFGKESLYTAATRAKKRFEVIGNKQVITQMLSKKCQRCSGLIERLQKIN